MIYAACPDRRPQPPPGVAPVALDPVAAQVFGPIPLALPAPTTTAPVAPAALAPAPVTRLEIRPGPADVAACRFAPSPIARPAPARTPRGIATAL
jgi:hypothetical protein